MKTKVKDIWSTIEPVPSLAENLRLRSELMARLTQYIRRQELTQVEAARHFGVSQPRISDLMRGRIDRFSVDTLVAMLPAVGLRVKMQLAKAA